MRVCICWSDISGYMAACWRALARADSIDLKVLACQVGASEPNIGYDTEVIAGLDCRLLGPHEKLDTALIASLVTQSKPDIVVVPGWFNPAFRALVKNPNLAAAKFVMTMDTPWRADWRQRLARLMIGAYLDRMDAVAVAGERAFTYATVGLRVPERKILRGMYGFDAAPLADVLEKRLAQPGGWPKRFLFAGRYVDDKAIDVLLDGYRKYRSGVKDPWPITFCGKGPLVELIRATEGARDAGFVQPCHLPQVLAEHGASVLFSRYEPWGVAVAEALASGMPVLCSQACGASVEMVRHLYNGLVIPTEDSLAAAEALRWAHENVDRLPEMGRAGCALAAPYSAEMWAQRWAELFRKLMR